MKTKDNEPNQYILQCRFFNGEDEAPEWMNQNEKMFWFYEQCWVNSKENREPLSDYQLDHPSMKDFDVYDGTPQDLKALICDRYCHFGGTDEGFRDFYRNEYQLRLTNKLRKDKEWELRHCRLYLGNGVNEYETFLKRPMCFKEPEDGYKENKTPEEIKEVLSSFYKAEQYWVIIDSRVDTSKNHYANSELKHNMDADFAAGDGTPIDLKVVLYHYFLNEIEGLYHRFNTQYETDLFKRYYKDYYLPILTPAQRRDKERRPRLIEKCRYYKGEKSNPWEYCYSPVLVWRKKIWDLEKEWVDAMVGSYHCPQSSKKLIKSFVLEEFFKSKGIALSLVNLIVSKEKEQAEENKEYFGPAEAIKVYEKYEKLTPIARDHRLYFAFYLGEETSPYTFADEEYKRMGWSQERMREHSRPFCDFDSKEFQRKYRGQEGIWGWYADPKFPRLQKDLLFFIICNWGRWCPYCDEDKLAEEYLNYHYPGDGRPRHSDKFYHSAALQLIKDIEYYKTVHKCGVYKGKRVYEPIFIDKYKDEPLVIGLPMVILVDDDGNAECIQDDRSLEIIRDCEKQKRKKT